MENSEVALDYKKAFIIFLSLLICSCTLPISLLDREFYSCWNADWQHRIETGLGDRTSIGMPLDDFLAVYDAHHLPGTELEGPYMSGTRYFGGQPENLTFAYVFFIRDSKGCPMHRFFFSEKDTLLRWEYLVHELGTYDFYEVPYEYIRLFHSG